MLFKLTLNDSGALARAKRSQRSTMGKILLTIFRREPIRPELAPKICQRGQDAMGKYTSASWLWINCECGGIARKWYSSSLQKHPFLLAPRRWGVFAKRPQQRAARTKGCFRRLILIYFDLSIGEFNQQTNKFGFFTMSNQFLARFQTKRQGFDAVKSQTETHFGKLVCEVRRTEYCSCMSPSALCLKLLQIASMFSVKYFCRVS